MLLVALVVAIGLLAGSGRVARADNSLQQSTPAADSTVTQAPTQLVLTFENPTGTGAIVSLACGGSVVTLGTVEVADNVVTGPVVGAISEKDCDVSYTTTAADGVAAERGSFGFTVDPAATATGDSAAAPASTTTASSSSSNDNDAETFDSLYVAAVDGSPLRSIGVSAPRPGLSIMAWSADGDRLFYTAVSAPCGECFEPGYLFMSNADGSSIPRRLYDQPVTELLGWID